MVSFGANIQNSQDYNLRNIRLFVECDCWIVSKLNLDIQCAAAWFD